MLNHNMPVRTIWWVDCIKYRLKNAHLIRINDQCPYLFELIDNRIKYTKFV